MNLSKAITTLQKYRRMFAAVIPFDPGKDKLLLLDFTEKNKNLLPDILENTVEFCKYINLKLEHTNARYGIGGYAELRTVYSRSKLFDAGKPNEEPRRLHLGTDIWGKPLTPVMAPLDGIVHSFAFNNNFGDYGATIILSHLIDGFTFYTLYGHLSLSSIKNLQEGNKVNKSDVIAEFGIPAENGHWPPHLHFQIILNMENWKGDYPGVCKYSEKEKYMAICPNPDLILQLDQYL